MFQDQTGEFEGAAARLEWDIIRHSPCTTRAVASKARTFPPGRGGKATGYKAVEKVAGQKLLEMLPPALRPSYERYVLEDDENLNPIVKAADKLAAHIKCIEELKAGNLEFSTAAAQTLQALKATGREEVDWFLDNCLEPFSRNIDQM